MHRIEIPPEILARAMRVREREHVIEAIDPPRTAHVIVDLQNGFMAEAPHRHSASCGGKVSGWPRWSRTAAALVTR